MALTVGESLNYYLEMAGICPPKSTEVWTGDPDLRSQYQSDKTPILKTKPPANSTVAVVFASSALALFGE
jgi:hypothetical protein